MSVIYLQKSTAYLWCSEVLFSMQFLDNSSMPLDLKLEKNIFPQDYLSMNLIHKPQRDLWFRMLNREILLKKGFGQQQLLCINAYALQL